MGTGSGIIDKKTKRICLGSTQHHFVLPKLGSPKHVI